MQFIFALTLILWGCSIIIGTIFGINIPFLRLLFAGALIYWGVRLIVSPQTLFNYRTIYTHHAWNKRRSTEKDNE